MSTHKRRIIALEDYNKNVLPDPNYEALFGDDLAPRFVPEDEFEGQNRPSPFLEDPFHANNVLLASRRLDRIAQQMVKNGFRGA
jgi:hypothetical protein